MPVLLCTYLMVEIGRTHVLLESTVQLDHHRTGRQEPAVVQRRTEEADEDIRLCHRTHLWQGFERGVTEM